MPTTFRVPLSDLVEDNLRNVEPCPILGESLRKQQIYPILVGKPINGKRPLRDGHRRKKSAEAVGITELEALEVEGNPTQAEIRLLQFQIDNHQLKLTEPERFRAILEIEAANPSLTRRALASLLEMDETVLCRHLGLKRLTPESMAQFMSGRLPLAKADEIAKLPPDEQPAMLAAALNGGTVTELAQARKRRAQGETDSDTQKLDSLKIIVSGVTISMKGEGLSLSTVAKILGDAEREAKAAVKDGQSAATFARVTKDRAKKKA